MIATTAAAAWPGHHSDYSLKECIYFSDVDQIRYGEGNKLLVIFCSPILPIYIKSRGHVDAWQQEKNNGACTGEDEEKTMTLAN